MTRTKNKTNKRESKIKWIHKCLNNNNNKYLTMTILMTMNNRY